MPHQDKTQSREHKPPPGKWSVLGSLGGSWTSAWYHRLLVKVASLSQEDDISTPNSVPVRGPRFRPNLSATRDQLLHSQVLPLEPSTTDDPTGHQIDGWAWLLTLRLRMRGVGGWAEDATARNNLTSMQVMVLKASTSSHFWGWKSQVK
ncbi:uncharacterized protein QC761_101610 [Podospora bellae-mahoneyi]|uniref:Uncharacterized protein n=1 Tax=Podospora bellae-mahoneyi TaxID=2093777 RepID=A0ABR0FUR0_9PEZI|nr:hypothetical protein QC761_101610 [Podospora bellae-mahoneyi]